jgi:pimeloyl-ACP methyl ester carboxylesterase
VASGETERSTKPRIPVQRYYETYRWKDFNINYRVEGEGPPILLIHGFGGNVNHYRFQFPALAKAGYKVYAIDLLGFGGSDKPGDFDYCIENFAQLCRDFCRDATEKESWVIAGNSIGGLCSLATAELLGDEVKACVLFNCAGGMSGFRYEDIPWILRPILWFMQKVLLGPNHGATFFEKFKTRENVESILKVQAVYRDTTNVDDDLLDILLEPGNDEGAQQVFLKVFGGEPGPTPESILPKLTIPILALWGAEDPWTPVDKGMHPGTDFGKFAQNYTLEILENTGHCPHDENPGEVNEKMIAWLKNL